MPLINCPECQKQISNKAYFCPHCGFHENQKFPANWHPNFSDSLNLGCGVMLAPMLAILLLWLLILGVGSNSANSQEIVDIETIHQHHYPIQSTESGFEFEGNIFNGLAFFPGQKTAAIIRIFESIDLDTATSTRTGILDFYNWQTHEIKTIDLAFHPTAIAADPAGQTIAIGGENGQVIIMDPSGNQTASISGHTGQINAMAITPDCETLIVAQSDIQNMLAAWHLPTLTPIWGAKNETDSVRTIDIHPSGKTVLFQGHSGFETYITITAANLPNTLKSLNTEKYSSYDPAWFPDGRHIVTTSLSDIFIWDTFAPETPKKINLNNIAVNDRDFRFTKISSSGRYILAGNIDLVIVDTQTNQAIHIERPYAYPRAIQFIPGTNDFIVLDESFNTLTHEQIITAPETKIQNWPTQ